MRSRTLSWPVLGLVLVAAAVGGAVLAVMALHGRPVNRLYSPMIEYLPMFKLIFRDDALTALRLVSDKPLVAFAHLDAYSRLHLWTLEFNALSIAGYLGAAFALAYVITRASVTGRVRACSAGAAVTLVIALTYVTSIGHCSGPTWAVLVALYGLGFSEIEAGDYAQWAMGAMAVAALTYTVLKARSGAHGARM